MSERICQYGNCGVFVSTGEGIVISGAGYRVKFCSWYHAASWCLSKAATTAVSGPLRSAYLRALGCLSDFVKEATVENRRLEKEAAKAAAEEEPKQ